MIENINCHSFGFNTGKNDTYFILDVTDFKSQLRGIKANGNYSYSSNLLVDYIGKLKSSNYFMEVYDRYLFDMDDVVYEKNMFSFLEGMCLGLLHRGIDIEKIAKEVLNEKI